MSDQIVDDLIANQCCPQCKSTNVIVGVDTAQNEFQEVMIECDICGWEYKTTVKNLQDAGFLSTCSVDDEQVESDFVHVPKHFFVLNTLAVGIAIQLIANLTKENIEDLKQYIGQQASKQYFELSAEQIQQIADTVKELYDNKYRTKAEGFRADN